MWSCDHSLVTLAFLRGKLCYHNNNFIRIRPEKPTFLTDMLGSSSIIWYWLYVWTWNFAKVWQTGEKVKSKCQKIFGANFYVLQSYREKTGSSTRTPSPIQNRVKVTVLFFQFCLVSWYGLVFFLLLSISTFNVAVCSRRRYLYLFILLALSWGFVTSFRLFS